MVSINSDRLCQRPRVFNCFDAQEIRSGFALDKVNDGNFRKRLGKIDFMPFQHQLVGTEHLVDDKPHQPVD